MRVAAKGELGVLLLGRFAPVRRSYGRAMATLQALGLGRAAWPAGTATVFPDLAVEDVLAAVRASAVYPGLQLPPELVGPIVAFAERAPCIRPHLVNRFSALGADTTERFTPSAVRAGHLPDGQPAPMAQVVEAFDCPEVAALVRDPALLAVARGFLGYRPTRARVKLFWSFRTELDDAERRRLHQTIDYHYDVESYSFLYVNFYLTGTDRRSGAHAMVQGSHRGKTLAMLVGSARRPRSMVLDRWGEENELVLEGPAGSGFVQDPSCYHRAIPPETGDRLLMQLRYS